MVKEALLQSVYPWRMKNKTAKILFVEDEAALAEIIRETLELRGFEVIHKLTAAGGMDGYYSEKPDLILLDITLPDGDGYSFARLIRQTNSTMPIIFLTSRGLPQDVVKGFEHGANDYVKKPFSIEELIVRIRVLLTEKRTLLSGIPSDEQKICIGNYMFSYLQAYLQKDDKRRKLTSREAELLKLLLVNRRQVLERKTILMHIWGK